MTRVQREKNTIHIMIRLYCRGHHHPQEALCEACAELLVYADERLKHCLFQKNKPTCLNCAIHCYHPEKREQIRDVMRFSGPRMLWRHPVIAVQHIFDGLKNPKTSHTQGE